MTIIRVSDTRSLDLSVRFSLNPSNQDIADCIVYHLGTMTEQSRMNNPNYDPKEDAESVCYLEQPSFCVYRGPDGSKCAFGYILRDEEYDKDMENKPLDRLRSEGFFPPRLDGLNERLLRDLQGVHDTTDYWSGDRGMMKNHLEVIYGEYGLDYKIIDHPDLVWNKAA